MRSPRSLASCRYHRAQFDRRPLPLLRRFSPQRSPAARPPFPLASSPSHGAPAPPPPLASYRAFGALTASCEFLRSGGGLLLTEEPFVLNPQRLASHSPASRDRANNTHRPERRRFFLLGRRYADRCR